MLCPYCLGTDIVSRRGPERAFYACQSLNLAVPREYVKNVRAPRSVVSTVGFSGHGKSVYLASLFHALYDLSSHRMNFSVLASDEASLRTVRQSIQFLQNGELPNPTPTNFPVPTIVKFLNFFEYGDRYLLMYDTSGESFESSTSLIRFAHFVRRSQSVIFLISIDDLDQPGYEMDRLLQSYIQGLFELNGEPQRQDLIVVLTKGDRLKDALVEWPRLWRYLLHGDVRDMLITGREDYLQNLRAVSESLKIFLREDLRADQFLNLAQSQFRSVELCLVSALGAEPNGQRLQVGINPKRVIDPIFWLMEKDGRRWGLNFTPKVSRGIKSFIRKAFNPEHRPVQHP